MAAAELGVVGEGGDLSDSREGRIAPALRRRPQPAQPLAQEAPEQVREPAFAVERVFHAGAPLTGPQLAVTPHAPAWAGPAVEIQRVHQGEPNEVAHGFAHERARLPI